jgi:uncharacterized membrane protein
LVVAAVAVTAAKVPTVTVIMNATIVMGTITGALTGATVASTTIGVTADS